MASKNYFPTKSSRGQRWGSGVREAWPQCRRRPQVYTSVKRVHSVWLHGQSFTKVHCVGPIPPPTNTLSLSLSLTHTHTHTRTPPPSAMPTQDTDNGGVSGHHVNLKYFPSLEQKCHPDLPLQTHFCLQFTQEWRTNSSFFLPSYNLTFIHRALFKWDMVLHSDEG